MKKLPVRERLIETASALFYEKGYNLTGINEILAKSGVAKASMYQHFRSKDEICVEYLRRMDDGLMQELKALLNTRTKGVERIMGIMDFVDDFFRKEGFRGCWCLNTISEVPRNNDLILDEIKGQKKRFRAFIQKVVEENLSVDDPKSLANQLYLLYEVAIMESQVFMEDWPIKEARALFENLLRKNQ